MSEGGGHTWTCSGCGRRVPQRAAACHCGTSREQAQAVALARRPLPGSGRPLPPPAGWRGLWGSLPADVKAMVLAAVLVLAAGFGWLAFGPSRPNTTPALLGYVERPVSARRPAPPPRPAFKLPWWK